MARAQTLLSDAIATFLDGRAVESEWSAATVSTYTNSLNTFARFLGDPNITVGAALDESRVRSYLAWLAKQQWAPDTLYAKRTALRMFLAWAKERRLVREALCFQIKHPSPRPVAALTLGEAEHLLRTARYGSNHCSILHLRDQSMFSLLAETCISYGQLIALRTCEYARSERTLRIGRIAALISEPLCQQLDLYLEGRQYLGISSSWLFPSRGGLQLTRQAIREAVRRHRRAAGLPDLSPEDRTNPAIWPDVERMRFIETGVPPYDLTTERTFLIVLLGLHCGLRRSEIGAVTARDVDFYHRVLHIRGKGDKQRQVFLSDLVLEVLSHIVQRRSATQTLVITDGGTPVSAKRIGDIVVAVAKRAGFAHKEITCHTLRHTYATHLMHCKNSNLVIVQRQLGHSRSTDTERYVHPEPRDFQDAVNDLAAMFGGELESVKVH